MIWVVWTFALLTAVIHAVVFTLEALFIERPAVHAGVFAVPAGDVSAIRLWAFGVGFYNLFIALGLATGVLLWALGGEAVGRGLVVYLCLFTFLSGIVLFAADRLNLSRRRGSQVAGAFGQGIPPLFALVAAAMA